MAGKRVHKTEDQQVPEDEFKAMTRLLWPDKDQQDEVFACLVTSLNDLETFKRHCRKQMETKPDEVWMVLKPIMARLHRQVYGADYDPEE